MNLMRSKKHINKDEFLNNKINNRNKIFKMFRSI